MTRLVSSSQMMSRRAPRRLPLRSRISSSTDRSDQEIARDSTGSAPGDIAVLFRTRQSHREFERRAGAPGDTDLRLQGTGVLRCQRNQGCPRPHQISCQPVVGVAGSRALLRSRFVRLSDPALLTLAGQLSRALLAAEPPAAVGQLGDDDRRVLEQARVSLAEWGALVDRLPPAELLDKVLHDGAYAAELRGPRAIQARENLKKMRGLVRRIQNRGYATMARVADYIDSPVR